QCHNNPAPHACPTRRSSDLERVANAIQVVTSILLLIKRTEPSPNRNGAPFRCGLEVESASTTRWVFGPVGPAWHMSSVTSAPKRSEEHTSELQSHLNLGCCL